MALAAPLNFYGLKLKFPPENQLEIELFAFKIKHSPERGGLGRYGHFRNIVNILWPKTVWSTWLERQCESLCNYNRVHWAGCAASGKTHAQGLFAMVFWLCDPLNTSVIFTSTTAKMIRKRIWPVLQSLKNQCPGFPGNLVDSKTALQARKGDDKNAIFAIAVKEGSTAKAVGDIQGIHNKRMMIAVDEAPEMTTAIYEAVANLEKGTSEFLFVDAGNPVSVFDEHGRGCEPKDGWGSITVDSDEWETKDGGICLHFDGTKSPALKDNSKLHFLYGEKDLARDMLRGDKSPGFWKFCRGFWAPEGVTKTVWSEGLVFKHNGMAPLTFVSEAYVVGAIDPSQGGDGIILRFARVGDMANGVYGVDLSPFAVEPGGEVLPSVVPIQVDVSRVKTDPAEAQIARRVVAECVKRKCPPNNFGCDATGATHGTASRIIEEFGNKEIHLVYFGGLADKTPISINNPKVGSEVYKNRVTQLWFDCKEFLIHNQLGGLDPSTIVEFCARNFVEDGKPIVIEIESKTEMKSRFGRSPDYADSLAVLMSVVKKNVIPGGNATRQGNDDWDAIAREHNDVWANAYRDAA